VHPKGQWINIDNKVPAGSIRFRSRKSCGCGMTEGRDIPDNVEYAGRDIEQEVKFSGAATGMVACFRGASDERQAKSIALEGLNVKLKLWEKLQVNLNLYLSQRLVHKVLIPLWSSVRMDLSAVIMLLL